MAIFAHSVDGKPESEWEPLAEHLLLTGDDAGSFANSFGCRDVGFAMGLLHDLGKYRLEFQARLRNPAIKAPHAVHGAAYAVRHYGAIGKLMAHGIAGHHAGLADALFESDGKLSEADAILDDIVARAMADGLAIPPMPAMPRLNGVRNELGFQAAFRARMLFSTLVDADYLATEQFYGGPAEERGSATRLADLRDALDHHLQAFAMPEPGSLNATRAVILAHARSLAETPPGVFTLTVPTGGGKTLTGLAFALDHAIRHRLDRIVVAIPFTSVVEQTAKVYRDAVGDHREAILEHHSAFEESEDERRRRRERSGRSKLDLAMENWDRPLVVTTTVQLFESLFSNRPSQCRKLHRLSRSVILIDEVQTLPPGLLRPSVAALKELAANYGSTIVLSTATQPALLQHSEGSGRRSFANGFTDTTELAPDPQALFQNLRRVRIMHIGLQTDTEVAVRIADAPQVLCIVNTRRHAQKLFEAIRAEPGARHLSTLMYPLHRRRVLEEIRADLKEGMPCRLVSTSLVEAGVDVDFPLVLRADAGLDSILQAAGRCNREGRNDPDASHVLVFTPEDGVPQDRRLYAETTAAVFRTHDDVMSLAAIERYFAMVYDRKGDESFDARGILAACQEGARALDFPFRRIADDFVMIEDESRPIIIAVDDRAKKTVERLRHLPEDIGAGGIARTLQPYVVGVAPRDRLALVNTGAVEIIRQDRYGDQFVVLLDEGRYHDDMGLLVDNPEVLPIGKLMA